jgi:hypothetical protein
MRIEKKLSSLSFLDLSLYFGLLCILAIGLAFILILIPGFYKIFLKESYWLGQVLIFLVMSLARNLAYRNGNLRITELKDSNTLLEQIELILNKKHTRILSSAEDYTYVKKKKWQRFFDIFLREQIRINITNGEITVFSKQQLLEHIEDELNLKCIDEKIPVANRVGCR